MILYSIDIETTGIDPEKAQILSLGIAELDTKKGLTGRTLNILFPREEIKGAPFAINMNADLIKLQGDYLMAGHGTKTVILKNNNFDFAMFEYKYDGLKNYYDYDDMYNDTPLSDIFYTFVKDENNVICLGKNFASFDLQFLKKTDIFRNVKLSSRSADIGVLFQMKDDENLPSMSECMKRSGISFPEGVTHNALQDAKDTALLYMEGLNRLKYNGNIVLNKNIDDHVQR